MGQQKEKYDLFFGSSNQNTQPKEILPISCGSLRSWLYYRNKKKNPTLNSYNKRDKNV